MNMNEEKMAEFLTDKVVDITSCDGVSREEITKILFSEMLKAKTIVSGQALKDYLEKKLIASVRGAGTQEADDMLMDILADLFGLNYRVIYGGFDDREPKLYRVEMETQLL